MLPQRSFSLPLLTLALLSPTLVPATGILSTLCPLILGLRAEDSQPTWDPSTGDALLAFCSRQKSSEPNSPSSVPSTPKSPWAKLLEVPEYFGLGKPKAPEENYEDIRKSIQTFPGYPEGADDIVEDLKNSKVALDAAALRETLARSWPPVKFSSDKRIDLFQLFQTLLPSDNELHRTERLRSKLPKEEFLKAFEPQVLCEGGAFTLKWTTYSYFSITLGLGRCPETFSHLVVEVLSTLENAHEHDGLGRRYHEELLVDFVKNMYRIPGVPNKYNVNWDEVFQMHIDASYLEEFGEDEDAKKRGSDLKQIVIEIMKWMDKKIVPKAELI